MDELLAKYGFSEAEIKCFWENAQIVSYRKRDVLLEVNQINRYLYLMKKGIVRGYVKDEEGKEYTKNFFYASKNELTLSFRSFMLQVPSNTALEAVMDCEVWAWHYSYIHEKLENDFRFERFYRHCTDLLYYCFEERETQMLRSTPEERYIFFRDQNFELINSIPLHHIATYLGITPETLSRIRKRV